jgi:hypothetical protein
MEEDSSTPPPLILGRPFLKTAKTNIDVHLGTFLVMISFSLTFFMP